MAVYNVYCIYATPLKKNPKQNNLIILILGARAFQQGADHLQAKSDGEEKHKKGRFWPFFGLSWARKPLHNFFSKK